MTKILVAILSEKNTLPMMHDIKPIAVMKMPKAPTGQQSPSKRLGPIDIQDLERDMADNVGSEAEVGVYLY